MKKILAVILSLFVAFSTFAENVESKRDTVVVTLCLGANGQDSLKADCDYMHYAKEEKAYYLYSAKKCYRIVKDSNIKNDKDVEVLDPQDSKIVRFYSRSGQKSWGNLHQSWADMAKGFLRIHKSQKITTTIGGQHNKLYLMPIPQAIDSLCVDSTTGCTFYNDTIKCSSDTCIVKIKRYAGTRFKRAFYNGVELPDTVVTVCQNRNGKYGKQSYDEFTADNAIIEINLNNLKKEDTNELKIMYDGFVGETLKEQTRSFILVSSTNNKLVSWLKEHKVVGYICIAVLVLALLIVLCWRISKICKRKNGDTPALTKHENEQTDSTSESTDSTEGADAEQGGSTPPLAQPETCEEWFQKVIDSIESSKELLIPQLPKFNWFQGKVVSDQIIELLNSQNNSRTNIDRLIQEVSEIKFEISKIYHAERESYTQLESERNQLQRDLKDKNTTIDRLQPVVDEYENLKRQGAKLQALKDAEKELAEIGVLTEKITSLEAKIKSKNSDIDTLTAQKDAAECSLETAKRVHNDAIQLLKTQNKEQIERLEATHKTELEAKDKKHNEATSVLINKHTQELKQAEEQRQKDVAAEQEKSREKIGEWYKDKEFYDGNLDSHLQGIKQAVDKLYVSVADDQMAAVYNQTIERSVTTLNMFLDYVSQNSADWNTKGCSYIYKCMQSKLREQLSDKVSWINSILRLFSFSNIPSLNERMQKCGIAFSILDQAYRHTVVLLSNYGIQVEIAKPFIDDYDNNAINSYFEYNNMDSMIESYTGLPFLREQYANAGGRRIITDMCRVAYFYQTDISIELVKGEVTFFS